MIARAGLTIALSGAVLLGVTAVHAQEPVVDRDGFTILLFGGGSAFSRMQNVTVETDGASESQPASLALSTTTALGAAGTYWFRDWLGLRIGGSYAPTGFTLRMQEADRDSLLGPDAGPGSLRFSDLSLYTITAAAELSLPSPGRRLAPYLLAGAGAAALFADEKDAAGLDHAMDGEAQRVLFAPVVGAGVRVRLTDGRVGLVFELTDHIVRSPVTANDGRLLYSRDGLSITNRPHVRASDDSAYRMHDVTFSAGLLFRTRSPERE